MGFVTLDSTVSSASIDISLDGIIPNNHDFSNFGNICQTYGGKCHLVAKDRNWMATLWS